MYIYFAHSTAPQYVVIFLRYIGYMILLTCENVCNINYCILSIVILATLPNPSTYYYIAKYVPSLVFGVTSDVVVAVVVVVVVIVELSVVTS